MRPSHGRRPGLVPLAMLPLLALLLGACPPASPPVDPAAEEAVIRQLTLDWAAAEASNNIDSALTFLWEDATMQPPNAPEILGHAAIRAAYESVTFVSLSVGDTRVRLSGDLAAIWGPLTAVIQGPNGPITLDNKFVIVWQRRGGTWKAIENSWNDNAPLATPGS